MCFDVARSRQSLHGLGSRGSRCGRRHRCWWSDNLQTKACKCRAFHGPGIARSIVMMGNDRARSPDKGDTSHRSRLASLRCVEYRAGFDRLARAGIVAKSVGYLLPQR
jgi:hypothetical protein